VAYDQVGSGSEEQYADGSRDSNGNSGGAEEAELICGKRHDELPAHDRSDGCCCTDSRNEKDGCRHDEDPEQPAEVKVPLTWTG